MFLVVYFANPFSSHVFRQCDCHEGCQAKNDEIHLYKFRTVLVCYNNTFMIHIFLFTQFNISKKITQLLCATPTRSPYIDCTNLFIVNTACTTVTYSPLRRYSVIQTATTSSACATFIRTTSLFSFMFYAFVYTTRIDYT